MKTDMPKPNSVEDLKLRRERSRTEINEFLEKEIVDHKLGSVPGWKAAFGARFNGSLTAVCVLGRPVARKINQNKVISISRYAALPTRPQNTGSWLIARARDWARLEGYKKVIAYAGVAGNHGTIYEATGFEIEKIDEASGDGWDTRNSRQTVDDFTRLKWSYKF